MIQRYRSCVCFNKSWYKCLCFNFKWYVLDITAYDNGISLLNEIGFPRILCDIIQQEDLDFLASEIFKNYINSLEAACRSLTFPIHIKV